MLTGGISAKKQKPNGMLISIVLRKHLQNAVLRIRFLIFSVLWLLGLFFVVYGLRGLCLLGVCAL